MAVLRHCRCPTCGKRRQKRHEKKVVALAQSAPQCWQAWPQHPGSSLWPHPTTGLSLLPVLLLAPPLKAWQLLSRLGVGVLQNNLHGSLASSAKCCLLREGAALLGAGHPRALCSLNLPSARVQPCSVMVVSGHLLAADPRPYSWQSCPVATGSDEINYFL